MSGSILQINFSGGGVPKRSIEEGIVTVLGLEGDHHAHSEIHGGPRQALLFIASEALDELNAFGFALYPGALGENLTTVGFDRRGWRADQRWRIGPEVIVEFTKVRGPCQTLSVYGAGIQSAMYDAQVKASDPSSPKWALSGFYAAVIQPGLIHPGDEIRPV